MNMLRKSNKAAVGTTHSSLRDDDLRIDHGTGLHDNDEPSQTRRVIRKKTIVAPGTPRRATPNGKDGSNRTPSARRETKTQDLDEIIHADLRQLALETLEDGVDARNDAGGGGGVRRLLKGKRLVRVKRVPSRAASSSTVESGESHNGESRKFLRVKVKRKKKEDVHGTLEPVVSSTVSVAGDVDSMAPVVRRGRSGRRRCRSDASVGTGVLSKARSWFTFGGMKLGSGGKDFLNVDDDDDDEPDDEDRLTYAQDEYDEATMDVRTSTPDEATDVVKEEAVETAPVTPGTSISKAVVTTSVATRDRQQPGQRVPTTTVRKTIPAPKSYKPANNAKLPEHTAPVSPMAKAREHARTDEEARSPERSPRSRRPQQRPLPTKDIVCHQGVPKKPPLTGVALRRLKIQEEWLSAGCNYKPNASLATLSTADRSSADEIEMQDEMSQISYDEPISLVLGPDSPGDQEVPFWTNVLNECRRMHGVGSGRTAEACLNKGVAELNSRQTTAAIESFLEAVQLLQEVHGTEDHLAIARGMHLLGSAFFLDGQHAMAVEATRKAFELRQRILGNFHTDTVDTFSNLAMIYLKMSNLLEATRIFNEVLRIRRVIYDDHHPSVAFPARSLGCVYAMRKDDVRARKNYLHALKAFETHGMLTERMDTEAEMRRFGMHPPVDDGPTEGRLEI